jgi:hypothetical protein
MSTYRAVLVLIGALTLTACQPEDRNPFSPPAEVGRLRVVHASPDTVNAKAVNFLIDGVPVAANQSYRAATAYLPALAGSRQVLIRRTADTTFVVANQAVTVAASADYSVLATGLGPDLAALVLTDDNSFVYTIGTVRVVNASPGIGTVDVYITPPGADLTTQTPVATSLAYRAATANLALLADTAQVRFTATGTKTELLTGPKLKAQNSFQIWTVVALDAAGGGTPFTFTTMAASAFPP